MWEINLRPIDRRDFDKRAERGTTPSPSFFSHIWPPFLYFRAQTSLPPVVIERRIYGPLSQGPLDEDATSLGRLKEGFTRNGHPYFS